MSLSIQTTPTVTSTTELRGVPLKTGQVLSAIVLEADQRSGQALLSLAGGQVRVQTQQPLTAGSAIRLAVQEVGPPLRLSIVPETTAAAPTPDAPNAALLNRLLGALAQRMSPANPGTASPQHSPQSSTESSSAASNPTPPTANRTPNAPIHLAGGNPTPPVPVAALPTSLQRALLSLGGSPTANHFMAANSPTIRDIPPLEPAKLAQTLSELVRHNSLPPAAEPNATPNAAPLAASTVHTALHRAALELRQAIHLPADPAPTSHASPAAPATTTPTAAVAQWLNQLETSQLRSAIQQLSGQASWLLDLPVQLDDHAQRLQLAIHHEAPDEHTHADAAPWQLDFALDLPNLGAVHGSLRLQENRLSVRLYANQPAAETALRSELPRLDQHLREAQFAPDALAVYAGPPPAAVRDRFTPLLPTDPNRLALKV